MTIRQANEIRPTEMPIYCSACHRQDPGSTYIDFDAACDRGYGNDEAVQVAYDDLILCANCLREGARHLGMVDSDDQRIQVLERKLDVEEKLRRQAQNYADTMEEAISKRPEPVHIDHRKLPRKQIEGMV